MNINFRRMRQDDLEPLYGLLSNPKVMEYLEQPFTKEKTLEFLQNAGLIDNPLIYAVDEDDKFIGYVIYHDYDEDSIEIGWVLDPSHWNKGIASFITNQWINEPEYKNRHFIIECHKNNIVSKHIALKYGFTKIDIKDDLEIYRK